MHGDDTDIIRLKDYKEFFKDPGVIFWEAGLFDYEIRIKYTNDEVMSVLNDWLCDNCLDNFVVLRIVTELVSGGNTDPKRAWERRKKAGPPVDNTVNHHVTMDVHIRLHSIDTTGFRLTWIL
jgi:hypothetical protein